jgi:1,4-dihydroxy-2-naphthoate octaprenyltransferase
MKILQSVYKLVGRVEYLAATLAVTLLGGAIGGEGSEERLGIASLSNMLLFSFAVIYQKIETAPEAAYEPDDTRQNPIASGEVSAKFARTLSAIAALLCLALAALLGTLNIVLGLVGVLMAIALSHHNLKLGNSALMRLGKHQPLLSVIFGLTGFLATAETLRSEAILLTIFLLAIGFLFAAWTAGKTPRPLSRLMLFILLVFASGAAYMLFIVFEVLPTWVLSLIVLVGAVLFWLKHRYNPQQQSLPQILFDSLTISTALSLIFTYLVQLFI